MEMRCGCIIISWYFSSKKHLLKLFTHPHTFGSLNRDLMSNDMNEYSKIVYSCILHRLKIKIGKIDFVY